MHDTQVTLSRILMMGLWALVGCLLTTTWIVGLFGDPKLAGLLGVTTCALSAAAVMSHIRCYTLAVCNLVRATASIPSVPSSGGSLTSLR